MNNNWGYQKGEQFMSELEKRVVEMYVERGMSLGKIARALKELNADASSETWVKKALVRNGIPRRTKEDHGHVRTEKSHTAKTYPR